MEEVTYLRITVGICLGIAVMETVLAWKTRKHVRDLMKYVEPQLSKAAWAETLYYHLMQEQDTAGPTPTKWSVIDAFMDGMHDIANKEALRRKEEIAKQQR